MRSIFPLTMLAYTLACEVAPAPPDPDHYCDDIRLSFAEEAGRTETDALQVIAPQLMFVYDDDGVTAVCTPAGHGLCPARDEECNVPLPLTAVGASSSFQLGLANPAPVDLVVARVEFSSASCPALSVDLELPLIVPHKDVAFLPITFSPLDPGACEGFLFVESDAGNVPNGVEGGIAVSGVAE